MNDLAGDMKTPENKQQERTARLALADKLFREFYAPCFWHLKPDLVVTEDKIPLIIKGLRTHGGRRALWAAAKLEN